MDQIKIGKFIAECRKKNNLTQAELAEKLFISDRAVSKWENGKSMPDSSIMLSLCKELKINVNDLLHGEVVTVENYNEELENKLIEMVKEKEKADRKLLSLEVVIGIFSVVILFGFIFAAAFIEMYNWLRLCMVIFGSILSFVGFGFALRIEQVAGYYKCKHCGHTYVPTYNEMVMAMHMGRTRYLKCPKCGKKSWQKKVVSKD